MSEPDVDDIDDAEMNRLFGLLALAVRAEVARSLLAGNDFGCFSTQQYAEEHQRRHPVSDIEPAKLWYFITPESHLRSIPKVVREVAPGIWGRA